MKFFQAKFILLTLVLNVAPCGAADVPKALMPESHFAVFDKYCIECHDSLTTEGEVNLDELSFNIDSIQSAEMWQKVLNVINSGEMPPEDKAQISQKEKTLFLDDLSHQMVVAREVLSDSGGVITMRRLNRREYENTVKDLLGVEIDASDLPDDANSGGFDTAGNSLFFSSDQFEQYLKLARTALDEAFVFGKQPERRQAKVEVEEGINTRFQKLSSKIEKDFKRAEEWRATEGKKEPSDFDFIDENDVRFHERLYNQQFATYERYLSQENSKSGAMLNLLFNGAVVPTIAVPKNWPPGDYLLKVRIATLPGAESHQHFVEYGEIAANVRSGEMAVFGCVKVSASLEEPQILEIPVSVTKAGSRTFGLRQRQPNSRDAARYTFLQSQIKSGAGPNPALWIDWLELDGPIVESWPPRSTTSIFHKGMWWNQGDQSVYAREVIEQFTRRAFRIKEPSAAFIEKLYGLYEIETKKDKKFHEAIREPLAVVMASTGFLYLIEPSPGQKKKELTDLELAVRLSYFLWSAPPDEALYAVARRGELKDPAKLGWHTNRMLNDPKADEFISRFAHQWLHMERLDFFQFDFKQFPKFDESVKEAARQEVYQTIRKILNENRPLSDLLKADHIVVNDVLADYYDIEGVTGGEFQKVSLPANSPRGGLTGMAAILAMGSDGTRSSPVERGAWVMRKLLDDPPPPAPANVPQISRLSGQLLSPREMQKAHMEEAQCAQCHRKIDPIGFGLQNFDAAGIWRDTLELKKVVKKKVRQKKVIPIDASGQLPNREAFADYYGLRDRLAEQSDVFARGFTESLIEYGLGRPYGFSDESLRERILKQAAAKDGEMRQFIHALIQSKPFRTKK